MDWFVTEVNKKTVDLLFYVAFNSSVYIIGKMWVVERTKYQQLCLIDVFQDGNHDKVGKT